MEEFKTEIEKLFSEDYNPKMYFGVGYIIIRQRIFDARIILKIDTFCQNHGFYWFIDANSNNDETVDLNIERRAKKQ